VPQAYEVTCSTLLQADAAVVAICGYERKKRSKGVVKEGNKR
jgi:hypothetical protein